LDADFALQVLQLLFNHILRNPSYKNINPHYYNNNFTQHLKHTKYSNLYIKIKLCYNKNILNNHAKKFIFTQQPYNPHLILHIKHKKLISKCFVRDKIYRVSRSNLLRLLTGSKVD
jgi:hypothetical protein